MRTTAHAHDNKGKPKDMNMVMFSVRATNTVHVITNEGGVRWESLVHVRQGWCWQRWRWCPWMMESGWEILDWALEMGRVSVTTTRYGRDKTRIHPQVDNKLSLWGTDVSKSVLFCILDHWVLIDFLLWIDYLIVIFVGLFVCLVLAIMLAFWCCKSEYPPSRHPTPICLTNIPPSS